MRVTDRPAPGTAPARSSTRLMRDRKGVASLEVAMTAPVFLIMVLTLFEMSYQFFVQQALDYATQSAARQVQIGQAQNTASDANSFANLVMCPYMQGMLSCSNLVVVISTVSDFSGTGTYTVPADKNGKIDPKTLPYCTAGPNKMMLVRAVYMSPLWMGYFFTPNYFFNGNRVLPIVSIAAFTTEDFPNSATATNPC